MTGFIMLIHFKFTSDTPTNRFGAGNTCVTEGVLRDKTVFKE